MCVWHELIYLHGPWDRSEQPGRGCMSGLNMQVCFTCGASVCLCVHLCTLLLIWDMTPRGCRGDAVFVCGRGRCLLHVKHTNWEKKKKMKIKPPAFSAKQKLCVVESGQGCFKSHNRLVSNCSNCHGSCLPPLYWLCRAVNHTCQLVGFCQWWGLAQMSVHCLNLHKGVPFYIML